MYESLENVIIDILIDILFLGDFILKLFFIPIVSKKGEFVYERVKIAKSQIKSPFFPFIILSFIPMSYFKYTSGVGSDDDI